jgi:pimeloyl-ACP methyl ester carboxylesterase
VGPGCLPGQTDADFCDPADVIPVGTPSELVELYLAAAADPTQLYEIAPYYPLDLINAPIQLHVGLADGQRLAETPPGWSQKLADGLEAAGKQVTFFTYPGQGHFFQGDAWVLFMERAVEFFDLYLK